MTPKELCRRLVLGLAVSLLAIVPALAGAPQGIGLSDARVRMVLPSRPAAAYFTLTNTTDTAIDLVGTSAPDCGSAMMHQSVKKDGVDKMIPVKSVEVPAHGTLVFAPGGYHIMCMEPSAAVVAGSTMDITLDFSDGSELTGSFAIGGPATK